MKKLLPILLIFLIACGGQKTAEINIEKPVNPTPEVSKTSDPDVMRVARKVFVSEQKPKMLETNLAINLSGENSDIFLIDSTLLSTKEVVGALGDLQEYKKIGFKQIIVTDKKGDKQTIDLEQTK